MYGVRCRIRVSVVFWVLFLFAYNHPGISEQFVEKTRFSPLTIPCCFVLLLFFFNPLILFCVGPFLGSLL